eukprot:CFRG5123T1
MSGEEDPSVPPFCETNPPIIAGLPMPDELLPKHTKRASKGSKARPEQNKQAAQKIRDRKKAYEKYLRDASVYYDKDNTSVQHRLHIAYTERDELEAHAARLRELIASRYAESSSCSTSNERKQKQLTLYDIVPNGADRRFGSVDTVIDSYPLVECDSYPQVECACPRKYETDPGIALLNAYANNRTPTMSSMCVANDTYNSMCGMDCSNRVETCNTNDNEDSGVEDLEDDLTPPGSPDEGTDVRIEYGNSHITGGDQFVDSVTMDETFDAVVDSNVDSISTAHLENLMESSDVGSDGDYNPDRYEQSHELRHALRRADVKKCKAINPVMIMALQ